MKEIEYLGINCVQISNDSLVVLVTQSVGPRVISIRVNGGENLFAELPETTLSTPGQDPFYLYGGHRLWQAPEAPETTYLPDDVPVKIVPMEQGCHVVQPVQKHASIQKELKIELDPVVSKVNVEHTLTNIGDSPFTCAVWAITQLKIGGISILPLYTDFYNANQYMANRSINLWPYTDIGSSCITWNNNFITIDSQTSKPIKVGFPNPRGWLAYWRDGFLFVKRAMYDFDVDYYDFGSSSECYCNHQFTELETLGPITTILPGESARHDETWEIYSNFEWQDDPNDICRFIENM